MGAGPTLVEANAGSLDHVEDLLAHFEKLESQFEQVRQGLADSHRLATMGTMASMVAHEINNILTPMVSYCQLAQMKPDDRQLADKAIAKSLEAGQRAAQVCSAMLGFGRGDEDGEKIANLRKTIDDAFDCMAREPEKDGIELSIDVPDVDLAIQPVGLQQVFVNLVLNARHAMRQTRSAGKIIIRGKQQGDRAFIEVEDTGPGIPLEIIDEIFEPFVTHPHELTDEAASVGLPPFENEATRGTGLGLCICRDQIEKVGGKISVTSRQGSGTTFHIELPVAAADSELVEADDAADAIPFRTGSFDRAS